MLSPAARNALIGFSVLPDVCNDTWDNQNYEEFEKVVTYIGAVYTVTAAIRRTCQASTMNLVRMLVEGPICYTFMSVLWKLATRQCRIVLMQS